MKYAVSKPILLPQPSCTKFYFRGTFV